MSLCSKNFAVMRFSLLPYGGERATAGSFPFADIFVFSYFGFIFALVIN